MDIYNRAIQKFLLFFTDRCLFIVLFLYFNINLYAQITASEISEIYIIKDAFVYSEHKKITAERENTDYLSNRYIKYEPERNNNSIFRKIASRKRSKFKKKDQNQKIFFSKKLNIGNAPKINSKSLLDSFVFPFGEFKIFVTTNTNQYPIKSVAINSTLRIVFTSSHFTKIIFGNFENTTGLMDGNNQKIRPPPFILKTTST